MKCNNGEIKDLLPSLVGSELDAEGAARVEAHVLSCEDCTNELALLQMMTTEPVPDPGEAFWRALPGRVYREVEAEKDRRFKFFDLSRVANMLTLPRWTLTAAATAVVLLISWFIFNPSSQNREDAWQEAFDSYGSMSDSSAANPSSSMSELSSNELDTVDTWAQRELSAMAGEAPVLEWIHAESEPAEELAELDAGEIEILSRSLNEYGEG